MNYGSVCQQVKCPLIKDVLSVIQDATIKKKVSWVYIQCGTNDLEHEEVESVTYNLSDVIDKVKQKFDNAKIVISSLLPRRDKQSEVALVNDYLSTLCDVTKLVKLMENVTITEDMLHIDDKKHVNDIGFKILLANIRYNIFGKLPKFRKNPKYARRNGFFDRVQNGYRKF